MSNQIPLMDSEHSPALVVSIAVTRNMLAGCQVVFGKGVTEQEAGDAEAAAVMALFEETYGKRQAVEADQAPADPDRAIGEAMRAIELAGAHPALTRIVVALEAARKDYRDYISGDAQQSAPCDVLADLREASDAAAPGEWIIVRGMIVPKDDNSIGAGVADSVGNPGKWPANRAFIIKAVKFARDALASSPATDRGIA